MSKNSSQPKSTAATSTAPHAATATTPMAPTATAADERTREMTRTQADIQHNTENALEMDSRRFRHRLRLWIRCYWPAFLLFLLFWFLLGACLLVHVTTPWAPNAAVWNRLHPAAVQPAATPSAREAANPPTQPAVGTAASETATPRQPGAKAKAPLPTWRQRFHTLRTAQFLRPFFILGALLLMFAMAIFNLGLPQQTGRKSMGLVLLLFVIEVGLITAIKFFITLKGWNHYILLALLPLGLLPAFLINLLNRRLTTASVVFLSFLLPLFLPPLVRHYTIFCHVFLISLAAIYCFQHVSTRTQFLQGGLFLGIIIAASTLLIVNLLPLSPNRTDRLILYAQCTGLALGNGLLTGLLAVMALPLFETMFRLVSSLTLNELGDLNTPLLNRLRDEAPGTYAHSIAVADLASKAAADLAAKTSRLPSTNDAAAARAALSPTGINPRLVYVMALYHDIGKLFSPAQFAENLNGKPNPHDNMPPQESSDIIREHVAFGEKLARKYHLDPVLLPAILQHHGNSLLFSFFEKARRAAEDSHGAPPNQKSFRYTQDPPSSREVALLSLADSCEAAVRALLSQKTDPLKITRNILAAAEKLQHLPGEQLDKETLARQCAAAIDADLNPQKEELRRAIAERIDSVFQGKIADHQLENADLTTRELGIIRNSFLDTLVNSNHARPEYLRK